VSGNHHLGKLSMHSFKDFSILWKLLSDIFWTNENVHENTPILLHFKPLINNNIYSSKFISPVLDSCNEVLNIFALCLHTHEIEWVRIQNLHHIIKWSKDVILFVSIKSKDLFSPITLNNFEFLINFELLLSNINNLFYFRFQFV